ncbi:C3 and PZP-like alpha-2-macroglobulin domain-containing protein 8 [Diadema antillarum]|uniref:C3 and PZP-like alpha-2-macroglobulin domain-containing protein 8 n=1 Tax=Diadema antillarum TaxID=105358 RepID=UPI003A8B770A
MTSLDFEVRSEKEVFIALVSSINKEKKEMYEIALGGWGNTGSAISECPGTDLSGFCDITIRNGAMIESVLSGYDSYERFWITFHNNTVAVGRHGNSIPFMAATYPSLMEINYVGVFTGYGSDGYWKFHSFCK